MQLLATYLLYQGQVLQAWRRNKLQSRLQRLARKTRGKMMVEAGSKVFSREVTLTHKETGYRVVVDNDDIQTHMPARSHLQMRNEGIRIMIEKLGVPVENGDYLFTCKVEEVSCGS
jgi:cytidylate kinase